MQFLTMPDLKKGCNSYQRVQHALIKDKSARKGLVLYIGKNRIEVDLGFLSYFRGLVQN